MESTFSISANFMFDLASRLPFSDASRQDYVHHLLEGEVEQAIASAFLAISDIDVLSEVDTIEG